jgi:hypothetical protein
MALNAADGRVTSRLTKTMAQIKNLDAKSVRGKRNVAEGLQDPNAILLLKRFNFNNEALLNTILYKPFDVNTISREITILDLTPKIDVVWPQGATHLAFTSGFAGVDFLTGYKDLEVSNVVNIPIDMTMATVTLTPGAIPLVTGVKLYVLKIEFFQEVNGVQYTLKNGAYNALKVLEFTRVLRLFLAIYRAIDAITIVVIFVL